MPDTSSNTAARIHLLGWLGLIAAVVYSALSWPLAAAVSPEIAPQQASYFAAVAAAMTWAPSWLAELVATGGIFRNLPAFAVGYAAPHVWQTLLLVLALLAVRRAPEGALTTAVPAIFLWSCALAVVSCFAFNVMTQDIWLSIAWGRMGLEGTDPYLVPFAAEDAAGLPLDHRPIAMTYGPLWSVVSLAITAAAFGSMPIMWVLLKLVLFVAWIAVLVLTRRIAAPRGPRSQAIALLLVGWMPAGAHMAIAEAHIDVVMIAFALLWSLGMTSRHWYGPLALVISATAKYVTAPLAIVDLIYHLRQKTPLVAYILRALPAVIIAALVGLYLLADGRLSTALGMRNDRFFEPADLFLLPRHLLGIDVPGRTWPFMLLFAAILVWSLFRLWRAQTHQNIFLAQLAIMSFILFTVVGHAWPWFLIWVIPFAAQAPRHWLSVFVLTVGTLSPFIMIHWPRYYLETPDPMVMHVIASTIVYTVAATAAAVAFWKWSLRDWRARRLAPAV